MIPLLAASLAALLLPGPEHTVSFPSIGPVVALQSSSIAGNDQGFLIPWEQNGYQFTSRVDPSGRLLDDSGVPLAAHLGFLRGDGDHFISVESANGLLRWALVANDGSLISSTLMSIDLNPALGPGIVAVETGPQSTLVLYRTGDSMSHARVFTNDGRPLGKWVDVGASSYDIAAGPNGFLLVDVPTGSTGWVPSTRFISSTGEASAWKPLPETISQFRNTLRIRVAFDGTRYVVVWNDLNALRAAFVSDTGDLVSGPSTVLHDGDPNRDYWLSRVVAHRGVTTVIYEKYGNGSEDLFGLDLGSGYERIVAQGVHPDVLQVAKSGGNVLLYANGMAKLLDDPSFFSVARSAHEQSYPQIAAGNGSSLVVWEESGGIRAAPLSPDGSPIGDAFDISDSTTQCVSPVVAFDGTNYLVAWIDTAGSLEYRTGRMFARRIDANGRIVDPVAFPVTNGSAKNPAIAFGDGVYLIAFEGRVTTTGTDILAVRVLPSANVLDTPPLDLSNERNSEFAPDVAYGNGHFLVSWQWNDWFGGHDVPRFHPMASLMSREGIAGEPIDLSGNGDITAAVPPRVEWNGSEFLVGWQASAGTFLRRFDGSGIAGETAILPVIDPLLYLSRVASVSGRWLLIYEAYPYGIPKIVTEDLNQGTFTIATGANQAFVADNAIVYRRASPEQPTSGAGLVRVRVFDQSANPRRRTVR